PPYTTLFRSVRDWRRAAQRPLRDLEAFERWRKIGDRAGCLDRNKRRLPLRIHLQDVPQYREIFFRQRHHHQQSAHLLGLKRFFDVGDGEILELYLLASEIVFLGECLDDSMVDLAAADANSLALEVAHALDGCTGRDDQYDGIGKEHDRTRVRRVF